MAMERVIIKFSGREKVSYQFVICHSIRRPHESTMDFANQHMPRSDRNIYLTRKAVKIIYFPKKSWGETRIDYKSFN